MTMTESGDPIALIVLPLDARNLGDRTIVWEPELRFDDLTNDRMFTVSIENVMLGNVSTNFTYDVTVIVVDCAKAAR